MNKVNKKFVLTLILIAVSFGLMGCKGKGEHPSKETILEGTQVDVSKITKEQALTIAKNLLVSKEIVEDLHRYKFDIKEEESVWTVYYEGKMPSVPGDHGFVEVQKKDGSSEIFRGE